MKTNVKKYPTKHSNIPLRTDNLYEISGYEAEHTINSLIQNVRLQKNSKTTQRNTLRNCGTNIFKSIIVDRDVVNDRS